MSFKLTKGDQADFKKMKLFAAESQKALEEAISDYNDAIADLQMFLRGHVELWREEFGDKSEPWQDSDKGTEVDGWIEEWDDFFDSLEPAEVDFADLDYHPDVNGPS